MAGMTGPTILSHCGIDPQSPIANANLPFHTRPNRQPYPPCAQRTRSHFTTVLRNAGNSMYALQNVDFLRLAYGNRTQIRF